MSYSILKEKEILPDFKMVERILSKLNNKFDFFEIYHHTTSQELFEFNYSKKEKNSEMWSITFLGKEIVSGGGIGFADYDDFYEDDYIFLLSENEEKIYNLCNEVALSRINHLFSLFSFSNVEEKTKEEWINIINKGIDKVKEDRNNL